MSPYLKSGFSLRHLILLAVYPVSPSLAATTAPSAIVVDAAGPWRDARWGLGVTQFSSLLTDAGYQVQSVSPVNLPSVHLTAQTLLAVPSLESLPIDSFKAIASFLTSGGTLMASGGEPFRDPLYLTANGQWLDQNGWLQNLAPQNIILNPGTAVLSEHFNIPEPVTQTPVTGPDGQSQALDFQLQFPNTNQWFLLSAPIPKPIFGAGQNATIVWTRGTPGQFMLLEWVENDGSHWIASIPLTAQWAKQVLLPSNFLYFSGGPSTRATTTFNPVNAAQLFFGVATGVGAQPGAQPGPLEFAVSAIGTATARALEPFTPPAVETLSPWYKQYATQRSGQTVRVPVSRGRGLSATADSDGRFRAIGNLLAPAATWYVTNAGTVIIWLPWPELEGADRSQLVDLLRVAPSRLYILNAGSTQLVVLPTENILLGARVGNWSQSPAAPNLVWSIADSSGTQAVKLTNSLSIEPGQMLSPTPVDAGQLPPGNYTVIARLVVGSTEVDRIDSQVRVFDPTTTFQPDERIVVKNGTFYTAGGQRVYLQGVNYWPRYVAGKEPTWLSQSWFSPQNYDPDLVDADLSLLASLNFNLVSVQYRVLDQSVGTGEARDLVDFLDRCRKHGLWANIYFDAFTWAPPPVILNAGGLAGINPNIGALLQGAFLPGHDRVFAYDLLWEPLLGLHSARMAADSAWREWLVEQYGSLADAEKTWGFTAPRNAQGQLSNPLDDQIENDGPWRVMVAAYRRFIDDFLGRSFGAATRVVRSISPGTLVSYRNGGSAPLDANDSINAAGMFMLSQMKWDLSTAAAYVDFFSPHAYFIPIPWPAGQGAGFFAAYGRYRTAGKPVYYSEYGINIGANEAGLATQTATCDSVMHLVNDDGAGAASVWWMPGGWRTDTGDDYGVISPDGTPRPCAQTLAQWGATFRAAPPSAPAGTPVTLTVDRDADARGDVGIALRWGKDYVMARQAGSPVVLRDDGTGTDTSTMLQVQVGNVPYNGSGPLKYANGELAGIHIQCPGLDMTVENGSQVQVPAAGTCQVTPSLVNTGSAAWLPTNQSKAGVVLHTNFGDLPLRQRVPYLQSTSVEPLPVTVSQTTKITGRLQIQGLGPFGETLELTLAK
ncbi:MAG TPA: hypothetical protein VK335_16345 [Bryobacteraceae bacterium]|nr:hypothetical protein [Bryobacteraceae bacterium]